MTFSVLATGDVAACRDDLASMFAGVGDELRRAPVVFGQLECVVSDRGEPVPHAKLAMRTRAAFAPVLREAGFTLMSFAGNHCLDWGLGAFRDTLDHVARAGVRLAGVGRYLDEALMPVIQEHAGVRIALVAASSILPAGYAAGPAKPGCAPMWAHTYYEQIEPDQPATPPRVRSYADPDDLARLVAAIRAARAQADVVLLSLHWGIHMVTGSIADYQREVAHAAIDAGADAILGHHPHLMKGIEVYRGKPVFYSLGNFAIEQPHAFDPAILDSASFRHLVSLNPHWTLEQTYMLPEETRITGIVRLTVADGALAGVRIRPCWVRDDSSPVVLCANDPEFDRVKDYLVEVTGSEGLNARLTVDGDELIVSA